jgi:hypothetical protein
MVGYTPTKGNLPNMARSSIDHNNRDLDQVGVVWVNQSKGGRTYLNGFLEDGRKIILFESNFRGQGNAPDYTVNIARYTDQERAILQQEQDAIKAQAAQKNNGQAPQTQQAAPQVQPVQQQPVQVQPVQQQANVQQGAAQGVSQAPPVNDSLPL